MNFIIKYRFFFLIVIYFSLSFFGFEDISTIVFFIAILDLSNIMSKNKKD